MHNWRSGHLGRFVIYHQVGLSRRAMGACFYEEFGILYLLPGILSALDDSYISEEDPPFKAPVQRPFLTSAYVRFVTAHLLQQSRHFRPLLLVLWFTVKTPSQSTLEPLFLHDFIRNTNIHIWFTITTLSRLRHCEYNPGPSVLYRTCLCTACQTKQIHSNSAHNLILQDK